MLFPPISRVRPWRAVTCAAITVVLAVAGPSTSFAAPKPHYGSAPYHWQTLKIGGGGFVTGLVVHPTCPGVVYGREDVGGLVRWNEATKTWTQLLRANNVPTPRPADYGVESVAVAASNPGVVYTAVGGGTANGRVLRSFDQGEHWSDGGQKFYVEGNNNYRTGPERLAVDPANARVVYFGTRTQGLWRSTDGTRTWSQVSAAQLPLGDVANKIGVVSVLFDPHSPRIHGLTSRIWATVAGAGVYRSDDAGRNWALVFSEPSRTPSDAKIANDGTVYIGFSAGYSGSTYLPSVLRRFGANSTLSTDVSPLPQAGSYLFGVDPHDSRRLLATDDAVRDGHLFRSTDGGATWQKLTFDLVYPGIQWPKNTNERNFLTTGTLVFDPTHPGRVWLPQGVGVWRSDDAFGPTTAVKFSFVSNGIEEMVTYDLIAPPGGKPISAVADRNGFRHDDLNAYPSAPIIGDAFSAGTSLAYAGGKPSFVVAVSSDTRAQYVPLDATWTSEPQSAYSTDGGITWTKFGGPRTDITRRYGGNIAVSADASSIVWMPSIPADWQQDPENVGKPADQQHPFNVPYVSRDNGKNWTPANGITPGAGIHDLIWWGSKRALDADLVTPGLFYLYTTRNGGEFFRSTDGGLNWTKTAGPAPSSTDNPPPGEIRNDAHVFGQIHAVPGLAGNVWASTAQGGLYRSSDRGDTWTKIPGLQSATAFGFGKAVKGSFPTVYAHAKINDTDGVWRSIDAGATWTLLNQYPGNLYAPINVVTGDMNIAGRVYVGFSGDGFVYGQPLF